MARMGALPRRLAQIHPSWQTPHVSTLITAALATIFYVAFNTLSQNFLFDAPKNFFFVGLAPFVGGVILTFIFIKSAIDLKDPAASDLGSSWLGLGPPFVIGVGSLVVGLAIALVLRARSGGTGFWARRPQVVTPGEIAGLPGEA